MLAIELVAQGLIQGSIYALVALGLTLVYGLLRGDWPIIIGNTITLGLALVILALKLRYGRHR